MNAKYRKYIGYMARTDALLHICGNLGLTVETKIDGVFFPSFVVGL